MGKTLNKSPKECKHCGNQINPELLKNNPKLTFCSFECVKGSKLRIFMLEGASLIFGLLFGILTYLIENLLNRYVFQAIAGPSWPLYLALVSFLVIWLVIRRKWYKLLKKTYSVN